MLRVTRLTDYATLLMTVLARAPAEVHSGAALAERARLELTTASKVLKSLAQAGLIEGLRGAYGGYRMARPAREINLLEIVEAIEGPLGLTECSVAETNCDRSGFCTVAPHWNRVNEVIIQALRGMSLDRMLETPLPPVHGAQRLPAHQPD